MNVRHSVQIDGTNVLKRGYRNANGLISGGRQVAKGNKTRRICSVAESDLHDLICCTRAHAAKRQTLICFCVFGSNWAQKTNEYRLKISEWSFFKCSEITQTYNKVGKGISLSMSAFPIKQFEDKKEVYYVNSWNHKKMFLDVISAVGKILKFKEDLRDFFEDDRYEVIDILEAKGLNVPEQWKRPKLSATNTNFTNRGFSTSNQMGGSTSHTSNNGTQRTQEPEEPKIYDSKIEQILRGLDSLNKNS